MAELHDLETQDAKARVLGSRLLATRSRTCHGIVETVEVAMEVKLIGEARVFGGEIIYRV